MEKEKDEILQLVSKGPHERLKALELYFDDLDKDEKIEVQVKLLFRMIEADMLQFEYKALQANDK